MSVETQSQPKKLQYRPILVGIILAASVITLAELLPERHLLEFHTATLVFIAAVYIGFGAADGHSRALVTEVIGASVFVALALVGLWVWTPALIIGLVSHAGWDLLHGPHGTFGAKTVGWYIPFCIVVDLAIGVYLLMYVGL
jgi:hypothetical protein